MPSHFSGISTGCLRQLYVSSTGLWSSRDERVKKPDRTAISKITETSNPVLWIQRSTGCIPNNERNKAKQVYFLIWHRIYVQYLHTVLQSLYVVSMYTSVAALWSSQFNLTHIWIIDCSLEWDSSYQVEHHIDDLVRRGRSGASGAGCCVLAGQGGFVNLALAAKTNNNFSIPRHAQRVFAGRTREFDIDGRYLLLRVPNYRTYTIRN